MSKSKRLKPAPAVLWPADVEARYDISPATRWRWERTGRLPKRDFYVGGVAGGWRPSTLEAAERGNAPSAA